VKKLAELVNEYVERPGDPETLTDTEAIDMALNLIQIEIEKLAVGARMSVAFGPDAPARARTDAHRHRRYQAAAERLRKLQRKQQEQS